MRKLERVNKIIIHHSLTEDGKVVNWGSIRRFHIKERGYEEIGYHYGIEKIDNEYYCLIGRPEYFIGAHTLGENNDSIGICFIGNFDVVEPEEEMLRIASKLIIVPLIRRHKLFINDIYGHRDFAKKSCPGEKFDLNKLKEIILEEMGKYG